MSDRVTSVEFKNKQTGCIDFAMQVDKECTGQSLTGLMAAGVGQVLESHGIPIEQFVKALVG
jgi:hypothetical protein